MKRSNLVNRVSKLVAITLVVASWLSFSASVPTAIQARHSSTSRPPLPHLSIFSDFDGDNKSDKAELFSSGQRKNIQVSFGNSTLKSLSFDTGTADQGKIFSGDIDGDNDEDLFWVSQSTPRKFLFWISDGQGNFTFDKDFRPSFLTQIALLCDDSDSSLRQGADAQDLLCAPSTSDSNQLGLPTQQFIAHQAPASISRPGEGHIFTPYQSVYHRRGPPANLS